MNFYSLDGTKIGNNIFSNNQIYENFENLQDNPNSTSLQDVFDNNVSSDESFGGVPTTKSCATDSDFQCSDNYLVSGQTFDINNANISLSECKNECISLGSKCIGFNYDTSKNECTLKKNATSLMNSAPSNTLCIKKSAGKKKCGVEQENNGNYANAYNELKSIFETNLPEQKIEMNTNQANNITPTSLNESTISTPSSYPLPIPYTENNNNMNINTRIGNEMEMEMEMEMPKNSNCINNIGNMGNNPDGIYVDLDCFMKNIQVLQNHTDNMMIDLSLLLSNIKSCSYVKKSKKDVVLSNNLNAQEALNQMTSKIEIPQPDIVKLKNIEDNLLVYGQSNNETPVLEVIKEPFNTYEETQNNWSIYDLLKIIIIIIILVLLIFRK